MVGRPVPVLRTPDTPEAGPSSSSSSRAPSPSGSTLQRPTSHGRLAKLMVPGRSRSGSGTSQSETPVTAYAEDGSAVTSGRSTPEQRRRSNKAAAASLLASDAKYKKYAAQVDKCLQSFESVNEWADFISFLSRLLKTLQTWSTYTEIPRKLVLSKRLAQCLNPALPSGVHQRALDVYTHIFSSIGADGLRRDMLIWSSGLLPFFQFASTSVRPQILRIFQTYYLPVGYDLRQATKAIILALLPGMEEETGDFFDQILHLFGQVSQVVSEPFFLSNMFLVLISSSASRLSALNYLARALQKPPDPDWGLEPGLIIRGVAAVLDDENVLVRRNGLDLLLRILKLHESIIRDATEGDRAMLMQAGIRVVLQREISLSRRVYTWLLGPDGSTEAQQEYFKTNSAELLVTTLKHDMDTVGNTPDLDSVDIQRPFKVFLSLLDKWEIGSNLSPRLAISALQAIKHAAELHPAYRDEILMTASAVYEAIEPIIIWRALFALTERTLCATDPDAEVGQNGDVSDDLTPWILDNVKQKDEEVRSVHIPAVLEAVLSWMLVDRVDSAEQSRAMRLAMTLLRQIPAQLFIEAEATTNRSTRNAPLAATLYSDQGSPSTDELPATIAEETIPRIVRSMFDLCSKQLSDDARIVVFKGESTLIELEAGSIRQVDSQSWLDSLLRLLNTSASFQIVDLVVSVILQATRTGLLQPPMDLTSPGTTTSCILDTLFSYLSPENAPFHTRCVELLWEYNQSADLHTLEDVIARRLSTSDQRLCLETYQSFGVLWKTTGDHMLPGEMFHVPVFRILDALRGCSSGPVKWAAESFMRNQLGSPFRILDPILIRLLEPASQSADLSMRNANSADYSTMLYLLENLETLIRFGGHTWSRVCHSSDINKSPYSSLVERVQAAFPGITAYLDILVALLLSFLDGHLMTASKRDSGHLSRRIHSSSVESLLLLAAHGDLSVSAQGSIKSTVVRALKTSIENNETELHPKMLELLQITLSSVRNHNNHHPKKHVRNTSNNEKSSISSIPTVGHASARSVDKDIDLTLVDLVILAISSPAIYPVLRQWIDFTLILTSRLQSRTDLLHRLLDSFSLQLSTIMRDLARTYGAGERTVLTEREPILLLIALERLVSMSKSYSPHRRSEDGRTNTESGGLLGLMSNVFVAEGPTNEKTHVEHDTFFERTVHALLTTWTLVARPQSFARIRSETRAVLERLFASYPITLLESMTTIWADIASTRDITDSSIFDCIDMLAPSAQRVVELLSETISRRQPSPISPDLASSPFTDLAFLEAYIDRLEAPIALQVWNTLFNFAREIMATNTSGAGSRVVLYPTLRCLTCLSKIVATTNAFEDRRLRRDLQEVYGKLLDSVVGSVPRLGELQAWQRPTLDPQTSTQAPLSIEIQTFLASDILPNLRSFLHDPDRVSAACASISTSIITPAFRQAQKSSGPQGRYDPPDVTLRILDQMTKIPVGSATKAWRLPVGEAFNDARFFKQSAGDAEPWRGLVCALMDNDRDRFGELLARITATPSANIFVNRDQETLTRSMNLRRLSFVLFAAEVNHYLTDLPAIQEALVDILRTSVVSPKVHSEVYRCLRVLMCRFSAQHLTNFWPVILAELLRVFEGIMDEVPPERSESLHLILAACKFLDLLLVIQSEDFQIHQWMFVTDTTDAVYPPEDYTPEAIMDRLAEIMSEHAPPDAGTTPLTIGNLDPSSALRRPRLAGVSNITTLSQLYPFFSRATIDTYEGVYSNEGVDWDAVEDGLNGEIFDQ